MATLLNAVNVVLGVVAGGYLVAYALRLRVPERWAVALASLGVAFFLASSMTTVVMLPAPYDFTAIWTAGRTVLEGGDPVELLPESDLPALNPPSSYPVFALFGLLPVKASAVVWVGVSAVMCLVLVPLSYRVMVERDGPGGEGWPVGGVGLMTAAFVLSNAPRSMLQSGQISVLPTLAVVAALWFQGRGRPLLAGVGLALGTIKINSLLPFLLMFLRRRDRLTWLVMIVTVAALCLPVGRLVDAPRRVSVYLATIKRLSEKGQVNDYTFDGPQTAGMTGPDYALYRLGLRDRRAANLGQFVLLGAIGLGLAVRVVRRPGLASGSDCALMSLYSSIFLYHRTQDFVALCLPLVYVTTRARGETGKARGAYVAGLVAVLLALGQQRRLIRILEEAVKDRHGLGAWFAQAIVLPYATWMVLVAMGAIVLGDRWSREQGA